LYTINAKEHEHSIPRQLLPEEAVLIVFKVILVTI
jgi:hypothetical protein